MRGTINNGLVGGGDWFDHEIDLFENALGRTPNVDSLLRESDRVTGEINAVLQEVAQAAGFTALTEMVPEKPTQN